MNSMPIVIGGNGGSGTRVIAETLIRSGVYLGQDLNRANDNLLFTYLFKHPKRFAEEVMQLKPKRRELYRLHEKLLLGHFPNKISHLKIMFRAAWDHAYNRYNWKWVWQRWQRIVRSKPVEPDFWGWKEPNSIFFLYGLRTHHPNAKFILVLRNGLDMVYTKNAQQFRHWAACFQITPEDLRPQNKFEYWYRSNRHVITTATSLFAGDFLIIKLEDLCLNRESAMQALFEFVGLDSDQIPPDVWGIPQLPRSSGRYQQFDISWIDSGVERKLAELGYEQALTSTTG